jgi:hypothetical protein
VSVRLARWAAPSRTRTVCPGDSSVSAIKHRRMAARLASCTGESQRRNFFTARGTRPGSWRSRASWTGVGEQGVQVVDEQVHCGLEPGSE